MQNCAKCLLQRDMKFCYFQLCWEALERSLIALIVPPHSTHSAKNNLPMSILGTAKAQLDGKGKDQRQIASLPTHPVHRGRPVNPPTPSRLTAFNFVKFL
jgi:hypothetical protein